MAENLHDHLQLRIQYKVQNVTTLNDLMQSNYESKMALQYLHSKRSNDNATIAVGVFAKSDPNEDRANIKWHVQPLSLDKFGDPLHKFSLLHHCDKYKTTSRGSGFTKVMIYLNTQKSN